MEKLLCMTQNILLLDIYVGITLFEINLKCTSDALCSGKTWKHISPEKRHRDVYVYCTVPLNWDKTAWTKYTQCCWRTNSLRKASVTFSTVMEVSYDARPGAAVSQWMWFFAVQIALQTKKRMNPSTYVANPNNWAIAELASVSFSAPPSKVHDGQLTQNLKWNSLKI